jgi:hypothetical protein
MKCVFPGNPDREATVSELAYGDRVLLREKDHAKDNQPGSVINILPNPSGKAENQWYDVRLDDYSIVRIPGRFLTKAG